MDKNLFKSLIKAHKQITLEACSTKFFKTTVIYSINENGDVYELDEIDPMYRAKLFNIEDDKMLQAFYDEVLCDVVSHNLIDPRLQLTKEQEKLVEQFNQAVKNLYDAKVNIICDSDTNEMYFYNEENVNSVDWPEGGVEGGDNYVMNFCDLPSADLGAIRVCGNDDHLLVDFND